MTDWVRVGYFSQSRIFQGKYLAGEKLTGQSSFVMIFTKECCRHMRGTNFSFSFRGLIFVLCIGGFH